MGVAFAQSTAIANPAAAAAIAEITVAVQTPSAAYDVVIGSGLLRQVGPRLDALLGGKLRRGEARAFVITSPEIEDLWGRALLEGLPEATPLLRVPSGEAHKRLATVERLTEELATLGADRNSVVLALGGGVIGDLAGFTAAIYMRGIPCVQVPTTLLAQVDSSVGGKTGANLAYGKNLVGAFHHPLAVYADADTLRTLPARELRAGLQEAVKAAVLGDRVLFEMMETQRAAILAGDRELIRDVVARSVRVKAGIVGADERESGLRMLLNLGHTLGHAIEAATAYTQLLHGEAVAWGTLAALGIASERKLISKPDADRIAELVRGYGPLRPFEVSPERLVALTAGDKKNRGGTRSFVLPLRIGEATVVRDVTGDELLQAARTICSQARMERPA